MADMRFGHMSWGREKPWCPGGEEALFAERSQEERESRA